MPGSGPTPEAMLVLEGHAAIGALQIKLTCTATWGHVDIQAQAMARGHVWVWGSAAARVCSEIYGSCCHQGLLNWFRVSTATWDHVAAGAITI